jgi:AraC-like DNA-binding protein
MSFQPKSAVFLLGDYASGEMPPHPALSRWISSYWTVRAWGCGGHVVRTFPDACVDLTLRLDGEPRAYATGPQRRAHSWPSPGTMHLIGARMLPGAAVLLGIDVDGLPPEWTPLERFLPTPVVARLVRAVCDAGEASRAAAVFDAFFSDRLLNRELDPRLSIAIDAVFAARGSISIAALARRSGAHSRTLARLFERWVGLTPKRFARIVRVQTALRELSEAHDLTRVAADLGYFDQAHFNREVRELFGTTPRQLVGLARQAL